MFVKGRLKPGATAVQAHANVAVIGRQLEAAHPVTNKTRRLSAVATSDVPFMVPQATGPLSTGSAAIMTVVGLVLLIACANVAGMLLARASARRREISIRLAIGATRRQVVRQMLVEGVVLGLSGAFVAVALAWGIIRLLVAIELPVPGSIALDLRLDFRVVGFAAALAILAGAVAALTPALKTSSPQLAGDLRGDAPAGIVGSRRWSLRDLLVTTQLALTAVLLVVAGLFLRTLSASQSADVGFRIEGLAVVGFDTDMVRYSPDRARQFWAEALERVQRLPGVESAAQVSPRLPFDINFNTTSIRIDGKTYESDTRGDAVSNVAVSPGYFDTLGAAIVEGRAFTDADRAGAPFVAIVNEAMARRFWPDGSAVGRTFTTGTLDKRQYQIVGVSANHKVHAINERPTPYLHFAVAQQPVSYNQLIARTRGNAAEMLSTMRRELLGIEPGLVFIRSATMEAAMATSLLPERVGAVLAVGFGSLGTLLAAIGLYGVIAYSVARRTREIGIRVAVGAAPGNVLRLVMRQGVTLAVVGAGLGALLAAGAARFLSGALYGVGAADPIAWGSAFAALFVAVLLANYIPARRAMRVDPVTALRIE